MLRAGFLLAAFAALLGVAIPAVGQPAGTLRVSLRIAETSFDPAFASDAASDAVISNILEAMLDYDYLARPLKLVPRTLEALPAVSEGGRVYLCRIRKGIHFTPDPAFRGQPRELTAADYAYSFKRHLDPARNSPWAWLLQGKLAGGDEAEAAAKARGRFDYDAPFAGLEVVDRYTLRIRLKEPDYRFLYVLAVPNLAAVAREVVEAYGQDVGGHPVGTGPYRLGEYRRSAKIVLEANPGFRAETYAPAGPVPPESKSIAAALAGKRLPRPARIEISIIEEGQSQWLAFRRGELDLIDLFPVDFIEELLADGKLRPDLAAQGMQHQTLLRPHTAFAYFNMEDPLVGGYAPEKIALRRAVALAFDGGEYIRVLRKGRALPAHGPIPPGVEGHERRPRPGAPSHDPATARALLDRFGYRDRDGDGYREQPDGAPLVLERWSSPTSRDRQLDELWKRNLDAVGLKVVFRKEKLPELRKLARQGRIPFRDDGWNADYPDGENFMQLLYGPSGPENNARFRLPEFDRLYERARALPDGAERNALFGTMTDLVLAYAPWRLVAHNLEDRVAHRWVGTHAPHPIRSQVWMYLDVDEAARARKR